MEKQKYDLEERTYPFALAIRTFFVKVKITIVNADEIKQVIRSSGSVGANYIEANEALSKKDFQYRVKICKKEAKETVYWLRLIQIEEKFQEELKAHIQEAKEFVLIFASILKNSKTPKN